MPVPRVFISYSHDSEEYRGEIRELNDRLRANRIESVIDQAVEHVNVPANWQHWMRDQIDAADFVLIACSENYRRRFEGREKPGRGLGARYEGSIITLQIYEETEESHKFIPVILAEGERLRLVPDILRMTTVYDLRQRSGFEDLLRRIHGQPAYQPAPIEAQTASSATAVPAIEQPFEAAGVAAERVSFSLNVSQYGRTEVLVEVTDLRILRDPLQAIEFRLETTTGIIGQPELGESAKKNRISWHPKENDMAEKPGFDGILAHHRIAEGEFRLRTPLRPGDQPLSFDFRVPMFNAYATNTTDFNLLYAPEEQVDVDGYPLSEAAEFFFRPCWIPARSFHLRATVPGPLPSAPELLVFDSASKAFPRTEAGRLTLPQWHLERWTPKSGVFHDLAVSTGATAGGTSLATFESEIRGPEFGAGYELKWRLPVASSVDLAQSAADAVVRLLKLRSGIGELRQGHPVDSQVNLCWDCFSRFARRMASRWQGSDPSENFDVSLMVFDPESLRLMAVLGWMKNEHFPDAHWDVRLPVGVGTAGEAYRNPRLTWFVRQEGGRKQLGIYLPVAGKVRHHAVLCVPIIHPAGHYREAETDPRAYVAGIVTLGSRHPASPLSTLGKQVRTVMEQVASGVRPAQAEKVEAEVGEIAAECQEMAELLLARLQNPAL